MGKQDFAELKALAESMQNADQQRSYEIDREFHQKLILGSGNRFMITIMQVFSEIYKESIRKGWENADAEKFEKMWKLHVEIVEAIEYDELKTFSAWENKTQEVIALQNKWKTIGFAPQKMNVKIFERFRHACDDFFKKKGEFFKALKEGMNENLEKKKALCEKAEALKESTDWKATADILSKLQKEWKTIGPVPKKYSDAVWKRFIAACDYFFEQKNKATSSQRSVEQENMVQKKAIIEKLNTIDAQETPEEDAGNTIRELMKEWNSIGHVPFKEKDKLYKQYHGVIDKLFDKLNLSASQKKLSNFKSSISKEGNLYREREKLVRAYENMKNEIQTYETNLGFLTSSSKKGSSLVTEMNRKVEKLKADLELILKKIEVIDQSMKDE